MTTKDSGQRSSQGEHVRVRFELRRDEHGWPPAASETLWAVPTGIAGHYRIDNIPFFVVGVSLGDVVLAAAGERMLEFVRVVEKSGHRSVGLRYRSDQVRSNVRTVLTGFGCRVESGDSPTVLAVDIPPTVSQEVTEYLAGLEELGELSYYENDVGTPPTPAIPGTEAHTPPFSEPPDLGVFVSPKAIAGGTVRVVIHDEDGDWVFLTDDERRDESSEVTEDELSLLCLRDVVASPEVHACADLPPGFSAEYLDSEQRWIWEALEPGD